ncbi:MAG: restriction endonuclease [Acidimicrobiia bacterium]|nr:restriction endonuclease [Acidimicrobiia bacterium]
MVAKEDASGFLHDLRFDQERQNDRSALVLLALLNLSPDDEWEAASNPSMRTVDIMAWIRDKHDVNYKPNTRETIRRQTLHQFIQAHLVIENPDEPDRPINSPKWCYQVTDEALQLARRIGTADFDEALAGYLQLRPGLEEMYRREREMHQIPVCLPDGADLTLSAGGQNDLMKAMIEGFCPRFLPGGNVMYVGDAGSKWLIFDEQGLATLGVTVDSHGKMPDLVVYLQDRNWLVLMEAASSHGPVDHKRHIELSDLFANSNAGLVFVSCFPDLPTMRKYLTSISWETEVWTADNPTHMIHFDGEKFLGPYSDC